VDGAGAVKLPRALTGRKLAPVKHGPKTISPPGADYQIRVFGDQRMPLRDFYHALLRLPWWATLATIAAVFLIANVIFAVGYVVTGGVAHAAAGSFRDAFFFSVQTLGTIGYGMMYPETTPANLVVVVETITGLTLIALATGLIFAKFSRSTARMVFSREAVICPEDGVPTLAFRVSNQRGNQIVNAHIDVVLVKSERTAEGHTFYRTLDLKLTRDHALSLSRSWSVQHRIDDTSPLHGQTPESLALQEAELHVMVVGLDDTFMQTVHAGCRYGDRQILWGRRHADIISETPDGNLLLDLRKFHDTEATRSTPAFPYPTT
jgi:inward rectifier potassium channel